MLPSTFTPELPRALQLMLARGGAPAEGAAELPRRGFLKLAVASGFALGLIEGLTKVFYPEAANTAIFVIMALILIIKPNGLFGRRA